MEYPSDQEPDDDKPMKRLMEVMNWGVEKGYFHKGILSHPMRLDLLGVGENGELIDKLGFVTDSLLLSEEDIGEQYEGKWKKRMMYLIYPVVNSREIRGHGNELNCLRILESKIQEEFGYEGIAMREGEISSHTIKQ